MSSWRLPILAGLAVLLTGCVSTERYHAMEARYLSERENKSRLKDRLHETEGVVRDLQSQMRDHQLAVDAAGRKLTDEERARLAAQALLDAERRKVAGLMSSRQALSQKLEAVLQQLGRLNGIEYESGSGKLKLSNKLLFDSGEAFIKKDGQSALAKLADALKGGGEMLIVEGHTDSDPVRSTSSRWKNGNWELSSHRAMGVVLFLEQTGVEGARMKFAGCGPHHPVASNATEDGKARNRRVEIYVRPAATNNPQDK